MAQGSQVSAAEPVVGNIRLSAIWVQTLLDLLGPAKPSGPLGKIGTEDGFLVGYEQAEVGSLGLSLPWPEPTGQMFWTRYFGGVAPGDMTPSKAWVALAPLRWRVPDGLKDHLGEFRLLAEVLLYPFGLALGITAWGRAGSTLDVAVQQAVDFRQGNGRISFDGVSFSVDQLPGAVLKRARIDLLGPELADGVSTTDPFTLVTVVRGTGVSPMEEPSAHVRLALNALATWDEQWQTLEPMSPEESDLGLSRSRKRKGHVTYASPGARVVWFPARFGATRKTFAMSCYHRNLTWASTQTASLASFVAATADLLKGAGANSLPATHRELTKRALKIVGDMRAGSPNTYRTSSVRRQVDDDWLASINEARKGFGWPALE